VEVELVVQFGLRLLFEAHLELIHLLVTFLVLLALGVFNIVEQTGLRVLEYLEVIFIDDLPVKHALVFVQVQNALADQLLLVKHILVLVFEVAPAD